MVMARLSGPSRASLLHTLSQCLPAGREVARTSRAMTGVAVAKGQYQRPLVLYQRP